MILDEADIELNFLDSDIVTLNSVLDDEDDDLSNEPILYLFEQQKIALTEEEKNQLKIKNLLSATDFKSWKKLSKREKNKILRHVSKGNDFKKLKQYIREHQFRNEIKKQSTLQVTYDKERKKGVSLRMRSRKMRSPSQVGREPTSPSGIQASSPSLQSGRGTV